MIRITVNDALTGFTAPKILWIRRNEPEVWSRIAHVLLPKDFVRFHLSNDLAVDRADGAGTAHEGVLEERAAKRFTYARCSGEA